MDKIRMDAYIGRNRVSLSLVSDITVKEIMNIHIEGDSKWNWDYLSEYININEVRENPDMPWNRIYLSKNTGLRVSDVLSLKLPNAIGTWMWSNITMFIDIQEIRDNPDMPWVKYNLLCKNSITVEDIPEDMNPIDWTVVSVSINMREVRQNTYLPWNRYGISMNSTIATTDIQDLVLPNATGDWINHTIPEK